jgi:hypothetical protein
VIPVIDIFAGPGGLGEGFSALEDGGVPAFKIRLSLEKDSNAHSTLRLRAFYRQFQKADVPDEYYRVLRRELDVADLYARFPWQARAANTEAVQFTLGEEAWPEAEGLIANALNGATKWLLIGGPLCQAYSLIGYALVQSYRLRVIGDLMKRRTVRGSEDASLKWADEQVPEELGSTLWCELLLIAVSGGLHAEGFEVKSLIVVLHVNGFVHSPVAWRIRHRILNAI